MTELRVAVEARQRAWLLPFNPHFAEAAKERREKLGLPPGGVKHLSANGLAWWRVELTGDWDARVKEVLGVDTLGRSKYWSGPIDRSSIGQISNENEIMAVPASFPPLPQVEFPLYPDFGSESEKEPSPWLGPPEVGDEVWNNYRRLARRDPLRLAALELASTFCLPFSAGWQVELFILSGDSSWLANDLSLCPIANIYIGNSATLLEANVFLPYYATKKDWKELWDTKISPALRRLSGELTNRRPSDETLERDLFLWQKCREGVFLGEALEEWGQSHPEDPKRSDIGIDAAPKAVQRVERLLQPIKEAEE